MNELTNLFNFKDVINLVFALGVAFTTLKYGVKEVFTYARNVNENLINHIKETEKAFKEMREDLNRLKASHNDFKKETDSRFRSIEKILTEVHTYVKVIYDERKNK